MSTISARDFVDNFLRFFEHNPSLTNPASIDLTSKTILIVGVNTAGVGYHVAQQLSQLPSPPGKLILTVRDPAKGDAARTALLDSTSVHRDAVEVRKLDLASFDSVREFVAGLKEDGIKIDIAVLNAGVMNPAGSSRVATADGWEMQLQVNHLATAYLSLLLLPLLRCDEEKARITVVGSDGAYVVNFHEHKLSTPFLQHFNSEKGYRGVEQYAITKLFIWFFVRSLVGRVIERGVGVNLVSPGLTKTELTRSSSWLVKAMFWLFAKKAEEGARPIVKAAVEFGEESFGEMVMGGDVRKMPWFFTTEEAKVCEEKVWIETMGALRSEGLGKDVEDFIA